MPWFSAQLIRGDSFPADIPWPETILAVIPLQDDLLASSSDEPLKGKVQLYYKKRDPDDLHPLVWLDATGQQNTVLDVPEWIESLQEETYRPEHKRPLTARLPFHYHRVPGWMRNAVASLLVRKNAPGHKNGPSFPGSMLNAGCEILIALCQTAWNGGLSLPLLVLTHDIDTQEGWRGVEPLAKIEEGLNLRSSWNVVPRHYPVEEEVLSGLQERGHEIGLHGIWHNNREAFLSEADMRREFHSLKGFMAKFGIKGFRSPSWYRTRTLFKVLAEFFNYDLSCPDLDVVCPAGTGGVGFMRPFRRENGLMALPCTLPFEVPLFSSVGPEALVDYWQPKIDFVHACQGMILVNTHPDSNYSGNRRMLEAYERLLKSLLKKNWTHALPADVSENFRR